MKSGAVCSVLVVKVASRCNLNCSYCYVYNLGDSTYKLQPKYLSTTISEKIIERVKNHCLRHQRDSFEFVFHGGEPLLASPQFYQFFIETAKKKLLPHTQPHFFLQTNGVLFNEKWGELFEKLNVSIGISLDGTKQANDLHRLTHKQESSYEGVMAGIEKIKKFPKLNRSLGFLSVIDIRSNPVEVYRHFQGIGEYFLNFLFPLGNYDTPPLGIEPQKISRNTPYADWLIEIFELWIQKQPNRPKIRFFELIFELLLGIDKGVEVLGQRRIEILSVETDGVVEVDTAIRTTPCKTLEKRNIVEHEIDDILTDDLSVLFSKSHTLVSKKCKKCPLLKVCGGGYILSRFSKQTQFKNPSVYCQDLQKLIIRVHQYLREISEEYYQQTEEMTFEEVRDYVHLS